MIITLIGTVLIAATIASLSEKTGFTHNGYLQSIIICIGGAFLLYFMHVLLGRMFGFRFWSSGMNAVIASIGALVIVPTHWRK
ncbi:hypothetical protein [Ruegeria sp.]|uniref:hypothetical protein n=1 Tax=Ruegeria sp. TaxID=1879320 RepID=UPI00230A0183|nr:hypothetical protein [Ruegeria sp.]MDA7966016.1 hypothetical protein [Ruegeria sp.]